ncbi:hypothetical protein [Phascolarctobacterium faecium]
MENKDVIAVNSVGDTENQCVAGGTSTLVLQTYSEIIITIACTN